MAELKGKLIGVIMGGWSAEREISLKTGRAVEQALRRAGVDAIGIDVTRDSRGRLSMRRMNAIGSSTPEDHSEDGGLLTTQGRWLSILTDGRRVDVAFLALHGPYGEDGTIQGMLEMLGVPYTGSGVLASALAMDKIACKRVLLGVGIPTPEFVAIDGQNAPPFDEVRERVGVPFVVKPACQGSSVGISIVRDEESFPGAVDAALKYGDRALIERFIDGVELTVPIIGGSKGITVLPLIEIVAKNEFYDYESKYAPGGSQHIIPPRVSEEWCRGAEREAVRAFKTLGCSGVARVDMRLDREGRPYVLEVNTIPGMTETSLVPDAAKAYGWSFEELVVRLVEIALDEWTGRR
ncbi:MAG: D-alanine--D-alanine ligase [bacterium]